MKTILLITTILLSIVSFAQNQQIDLKDKVVRKHFTKGDIKNLNKILIFFDSVAKKDCIEEDLIAACYEKYCQSIKNISETDSFDLKFTFKQEKKLFEEMGQGTFNKIWYYTQPYRIVNGKKVSDFPETVELFYKSPFMDMCKSLSVYNPNIKFYHETYLKAGTMNSEMIEIFFSNIDKFNFSNPRERLIVAVHFLTVNSRFYNE